jgi:hypothetical protein
MILIVSMIVMLAVVLNVGADVLFPLVVSIALAIVTTAQVVIAKRQAVTADKAAKAATRLASYSHLARLWYDLKARGIEAPEFINPVFTTLYRPRRSDQLHVRYDTYAWMCWGHAEDCFVHGYHKDPGFLPSIESYKELHCTWLYNPNNRKHFSAEFLQWVTNELLVLKISSRPSPVEGTGVFADQGVEEGEYIGSFLGVDRDVPTRMSVQFGLDHHVDPAHDSVLRHLNHSCAPNSFFRGRNLYALRQIQPDGEVTIDYNCSEEETSKPFPCACGYGSCVKEVRGWRHLTEQQRWERREIAPPWLLEQP